MKLLKMFPSVAKTVAAVAVCSALATTAHANSVTNLGTLAAPGSYTYAQSYFSPVAGFSDLFTFTVPESSLNGVTATIGFGSILGLGSLGADLYAGILTNPLSIPSSATLIASGVTTPITSGSQTVGLSSVFGPITVAAGSYTLNIHGSVIGAFGGSYSGMLNVTPVPEPSSALALVAGLGLIGFTMGRKKSSQG